MENTRFNGSVHQNEKCSCIRKFCKRHGNCKECIEHHEKDFKGIPPYCMKGAKKPGTKA